MAELLFKKGSFADFKEKVKVATEGALYLTEDEGGLYIGKKDGTTQRIQGSVIMCDNIHDVVEKVGNPPYSTDVIYFDAEDNALVRWNGTKWVQLNETAEGVANKITGLQNQITALGNRVTTAEGEIDALQAGLEKEISDRATAEAALKADYKSLIDAEAKTARAAESAAQAAAEAAQASADANSGLITSLTTKVGEVETLAKSKTTMAEVEAKGYATVAYVDGQDNALKGTSADASTAITIYGARALAQQGVNDASAANTAAGNAQSAADKANAAVATEKARAEGVEAGLRTDVDAKVAKSDYNTKMSSIDSTLADHASSIGAVETTANNALSRVNGGTIEKDVTIAEGAKLIVTDTPTSNLHAANKAYVDNAITKVNSAAGELDNRVSAVEQKATDNAAAIAKNASDISATNTALSEYKSANDAAVAEKANTEDVAATYATKTELSNAKTALVGAAATEDTIRWAASKADAAKTAADNAQATAKSNTTSITTINGEISTIKTNVSKNATAISDETAARKTAVSELAATVAANESDIEKKVSDEIAARKAADSALETKISGIEGSYLKLAGGTMTGNINMNSHKITGLVAAPTAADEAASKAYVDAQMQAADAMVFKGVLGSGANQVSALPTTGVQKGWTYKVGVAATYGGIAAKVGDLIINSGEDNATPVWVHVTSGYEDDYLQKVFSSTSGSNVVIGVDDGVNRNSANSSITLVSANNIAWSQNAGQVTASIVWGTF